MRAMPLVSLIVCASLAVAPSPASASDPAVYPNVRPLDDTAGHFLRFGAERSDHFRSLVHALERSNVIVYVQVRQEASHPVSGGLTFLGETNGVRWLRATVDAGTGHRVRAFQDIVRLTAILGHELHHALEASEAASLADVHEFEQYFRMLGDRDAGVVLDTEGARAAGRLVAAELRGMESSTADWVRAARPAAGGAAPGALAAR